VCHFTHIIVKKLKDIFFDYFFIHFVNQTTLRIMKRELKKICYSPEIIKNVKEYCNSKLELQKNEMKSVIDDIISKYGEMNNETQILNKMIKFMDNLEENSLIDQAKKKFKKHILNYNFEHKSELLKLCKKITFIESDDKDYDRNKCDFRGECFLNYRFVLNFGGDCKINFYYSEDYSYDYPILNKAVFTITDGINKAVSIRKDEEINVYDDNIKKLLESLGLKKTSVKDFIHCMFTFMHEYYTNRFDFNFFDQYSIASDLKYWTYKGDKINKKKKKINKKSILYYF
jgi:hypothetical protein